ILSAAQKHKICQVKEINPNIKNVDLATNYQVGKSTIMDILKEKDRWLAIMTKEEDKIKKFHRPKWPNLEEALGFWKKTGILPYNDPEELVDNQDSDMDDETRLAELIGCLSTDDSLTVYEYIHAKDDEIKGGLTEEEILEI
ncbi:12733_t:CDS:2, partial [Cetraspora pellucida]